MKSGKISPLPLLFIILAGISIITSCRHEADISSFPDICFSRDVLPIFSNNCAISGCHDKSGGEQGALTNYAEIRNAVVPFKPEKSSVYKAITSTWGVGQMPPGQTVSQEKRTIIRLWIEQGATETTCPPAASGVRTTVD